MKKTFFLFIILSLSTLYSCREEFSQEDALDLLNSVDISVYVYNRSLDYSEPVQNARVKITQGNSVYELTSDSNGLVNVEGAEYGKVFISVEADGFTSWYSDVSFYSTGEGQNQQTYSVGIYSLSDESLAKVSGKVLIEKDLTNDTAEFADGITLNLRISLSEGSFEFRAVTDKFGNYEFHVPSENRGGYASIRIPDLEINQKIAYHKIASDSRRFPEVLPTTDLVPTVFSTNTGYLRNHNNYPVNEIWPIYAVADPAPDEIYTAVIDEVYSDYQGGINWLSFSYGGYYLGDPDEVVNIHFHSLATGSGATMQVFLTNYYNLRDAVFNGDYSLVPGSGYPEADQEGDSYLLNRTPYREPVPRTSDNREVSLGYLLPGSNTILNIDYGTGVYRLHDLD